MGDTCYSDEWGTHAIVMSDEWGTHAIVMSGGHML